MKRKIRKNRLMVLIAGLLGFIILCGALISFLFDRNSLITTSKAEICIHETIDARSFLKKKYKDKDVLIEGNVNVEQLGEYELTYTFDKKKDKLHVIVQDRLNPEVTLKEKTYVQGENIVVDDLIESIEDDSKTTVSFEEKYNFSEVGEYKVKVIVSDEFKNTTVEETTVYIEKKDEIPPVMQGLDKITINVGQTIPYYDGVSVVDNQDPNPEFTIDTSHVRENVAGVYEIYYTAKDRQGNEAVYTREIEIVQVETGEKVIYLTIDDGPSFNTPEVLDILNRYNAKATFFVTGMCPEYFDYIKLAHDQGHAIGMHTFSHRYDLIYSSDEAYIEDLNQITNVVESQIGYRPNIFRFPGGSSNTVSAQYNTGIVTRLIDYANRQGLIYYDWNADSGDGSGMTASDMITKAINEGSGVDRIVMLMHDGRGSTETVKALPAIIEHYQSQGYVFKAIDENAPTAHHRTFN